MHAPSDKALLKALSKDFPESLTPYKDLAGFLGISEELLLDRIHKLTATGKIRRLGATLNHRLVGYRANALTVWMVPEEKIEAFGKLASARPEISHCYLRKAYPNWPYNLYTVIHGAAREDCEKVARELAQIMEIKEYQLLFSIKEFKKTSLQI